MKGDALSGHEGQETEPVNRRPGDDVLTSSRLKTARRCLREHHYTYELGYRPAVVPEAMAFGSLIHRALEAWWLAAQAEQRGEDTIGRLDAALVQIAAEVADPYVVARARGLMAAYEARWADDLEFLEVLHVEVPFEIDVINPATGAASRTWRMAGRLDGIVRDRRDGRILALEHKTSTEAVDVGSDYWKRLKMDGQVSAYMRGGESIVGEPLSGCLYDVLSRPLTRPAKATQPEARKFTKDGRLYANQRLEDETPDEFFTRFVEAIAEDPNRYLARGEVVRIGTELEDHDADVWALGKMIREGQLAARWPRNPEACVRYGRTCQFFGVCTNEASLDDATLFVRIDVTHPELEVAVGEAA